MSDPPKFAAFLLSDCSDPLCLPGLLLKSDVEPGNLI